MPHAKIAELIGRLIGQECERSSLFDQIEFREENLNIGFSQFNEVLLLLGCDRINKSFFDFLANSNGEIKVIGDLESSVDKFHKLALLFFGNIQEAFQILSKSDSQLEDILDIFRPKDLESFKKRHAPILGIQKIPEDKTYYLGYIVHEEIKEALRLDPNDAEALKQHKEREEIVNLGKRNQEAYLASDHMDVYVATSMREKHEFLQVSRISDKIFKDELLKSLNLRYFDPTQAYCEDRIDKGISEGLMLKRAICTIYMAQESDTLGKDSELATTLAQGKPVIAYIPEGNEQYVADLIEDLVRFQTNKNRKQIILSQLQIFDSKLAWTNPEVLEKDEETLFGMLVAKVKTYYDKRAKTLSKDHPLGIQVILSNGVANGVLVVRTIKACVELLRDILANNLEFDLEKKYVDGIEYLLLVEKKSGCIFRVITSNKSLTRSFWNYYFAE